ncbi:MAG: hypothetical protein AB7D51_06595 [Desulfovibrionaceae bacterium]
MTNQKHRKDGNALRGMLARASAGLVAAALLGCWLLAAPPAQAKPYPRDDHWGLSENQRQRPHHRKDDYAYDEPAYRTDQYLDHQRPRLSDLPKNPEPSVSFERVSTQRYKMSYDLGKYDDLGRTWYDENQEYNPIGHVQPIDNTDNPYAR